jgi:hypothetical protein
MRKMVEEEKDCYHRHTYIDLGRGTPFSLAWLVWQTELLVNVNWHGLCRKRVQGRLYCYNTLQINYTVLYCIPVLWSRVGAARLTCTDPDGTCTNKTI